MGALLAPPTSDDVASPIFPHCLRWSTHVLAFVAQGGRRNNEGGATEVKTNKHPHVSDLNFQQTNKHPHVSDPNFQQYLGDRGQKKRGSH